MREIKVSEINEMSNEELISVIVDVAVQVAHRGGTQTQALRKSEERAINELSARLDLNKEKLLELLDR